MGKAAKTITDIWGLITPLKTAHHEPTLSTVAQAPVRTDPSLNRYSPLPTVLGGSGNLVSG